MVRVRLKAKVMLDVEHDVGDTVDIDPDIASSLIRRGLAEVVKGSPPETASVKPPESAVLQRPKPRDGS